MIRISSLNNQRIKDVVRLNHRRQRDEKMRTIVEGEREVSRALQAGIVPVETYICPELITDFNNETIQILLNLAQNGATQLFEVTPAVYEKMAYRGGSEGLLLVIPYMSYAFADLASSPVPFLVIIDGVEKPGNLGAILRTADAAGVDGLILTGDEGIGTDIHNPNVIRASLGAIFTVPVVSKTAFETISWLKDEGIMIVATSPEVELLYTAASLTGPIAIVLGSEAYGLGATWLDAAAQKVRIPMFGKVDSLNVSVSAALLLYEALRQRQFKTN